MNNSEKKATFALASIYALRMLGLFLIIPVFSILGRNYFGSNNLKIGLAVGIYGLAQAIFYLPFGIASDKLGRKPVILFGLFLFFLGSIVAAFATSIEIVILGRAIQGSGAISSSVSALLADLTSDKNRSKAMTIIGASICLSFFLAFMIAPPLSKLIGLSGIFLLMATLTIIATGAVLWIVPDAPAATPSIHRISILSIIKNKTLSQLNFGVFVLHISQGALFMLLPQKLKNLNIPLDEHWLIYLPVFAVSFILMYPIMRYAEKYSYSKQAMLFSIALMLLSTLYFTSKTLTIFSLSIGLLVYFVGFNLLESSQPAWVSRLSPVLQKGAAMGIYNTSQALGLFFGGTISGALSSHGERKIFFYGAILLSVWFLISCQLKLETDQHSKKYSV